MTEAPEAGLHRYLGDAPVREIIGYVALAADGTPHRPKRSGYSWQSNITNPPRVYTTKKRAEAYSPVGSAKPVYMEVST